MSTTTAPVLERAGELERLAGAFADALAGHGQLVLVEGPSGIGKSSLLAHAQRMAADAGLDVVAARGGELERDYAFGLVLKMFESRFAGAGEDEQRHLLRGRAALARALLSPPDPDSGPATPADEFDVIHGLYWHVVNRSEERPVALLVDDVQWADDLSFRFVLYLADRLHDLPVVVVAAVRTGDPAADPELMARLLAAGTLPSIRPAELSRSAVRELLARSALPADVGEAFVDEAWDATRGNPFLVHELLTALETHGGSRETLASFAPQTVRAQVLLRLLSLGRDALRLAQACSVLGDDVPLTDAARLAKIEIDDAMTAAERLAHAQILTRGDTLSFVHPLIRSAVYDEIEPGDRPRAHAWAARMLYGQGAAPERVAHHLLAAPPSQEPWVGETLHAAARVLLRRGAPTTAAQYLSRALATNPVDDRRAAILVDLGLAEASSGQTTSVERFDEALALIRNPQDQARALQHLGNTLYRYGRHDEAGRIFQRGIELCQDADPELAHAFEGAWLCAACFFTDVYADLGNRAETLAARIDRDRPLTVADRVVLAVLALHRVLNLDPSGIDLAREALGEDVVLAERDSSSMAATLAILALTHAGRFGAAQAAAESFIQGARRRSSALAFAEATFVRAVVMLHRGRITEAAADAQTAMEATSQGFRGLGPLPHATLATCLVERGELEAAESVLREAESAMLPTSRSGPNAHVHMARGRASLLRGDFEAALDAFLQAGTEARAYGPNPVLLPWRSLAGAAASRCSQPARALELVDEEIAIARRFGLPASLGAALRIRALAVGGPELIPALQEAVAVLEQADSDVELARALFDLGSAHRRRGERIAGREHLRRALDLAARTGAVALEVRAREELQASGAKLRRTSLSGVASLTPSERRVAELAAAGRSNREIAEMLFLTPSTIAWHLRQVFRKLDVHRRTDLAARLADED